MHRTHRKEIHRNHHIALRVIKPSVREIFAVRYGEMSLMSYASGKGPD